MLDEEDGYQEIFVLSRPLEISRQSRLPLIILLLWSVLFHAHNYKCLNLNANYFFFSSLYHCRP